MKALEVEHLRKTFGGIVAADDVSFSVDAGKVQSLIGPNGAGKTTVLNLISAFYTTEVGSVRVFGNDTTRLPPHRMVEFGLSRTFQNIRLFREMSALDNVVIGCHVQSKTSLPDVALRTKRSLQKDKEAVEVASRCLEITNLADRSQDLARSLPYGTQRKLELARSLATGARMILLDEPSAGMNQSEAREFGELLLSLVEREGYTFLLVSHDLELVMGVSDSVLVMNQGRVIASGKPFDVQNDVVVQEAYLGKVSRHGSDT